MDFAKLCGAVLILALAAGCQSVEGASDVDGSDIGRSDAGETAEGRPEASDDAPTAPDPDRLFAPGTPEFDALTTDDFIVEEIKRNEALRLESYVGPNGNILIGYGHLLPNGTLGITITEAEADRLLREDLREAERFVRLSVTQPIRRREFSALVDFTYNAGVGRLRESEMLRLFNLGDRQGAADAFLTARVMIGSGANRRVSTALQERRRVARAHFLGIDP